MDHSLCPTSGNTTLPTPAIHRDILRHSWYSARLREIEVTRRWKSRRPFTTSPYRHHLDSANLATFKEADGAGTELASPLVVVHNTILPEVYGYSKEVRQWFSIGTAVRLVSVGRLCCLNLLAPATGKEEGYGCSVGRRRAIEFSIGRSDTKKWNASLACW